MAAVSSNCSFGDVFVDLFTKLPDALHGANSQAVQDGRCTRLFLRVRNDFPDDLLAGLIDPRYSPLWGWSRRGRPGGTGAPKRSLMVLLNRFLHQALPHRMHTLCHLLVPRLNPALVLLAGLLLLRLLQVGAAMAAFYCFLRDTGEAIGAIPDVSHREDCNDYPPDGAQQEPIYRSLQFPAILGTDDEPNHCTHNGPNGGGAEIACWVHASIPA